MKKIYIILIWVMVATCGGCAFTEVLADTASVAGLVLILAGLSLIVYITRLPVEVKGGN
jgi:hypothetical protein